jgi:hypothetical protein
MNDHLPGRVGWLNKIDLLIYVSECSRVGAVGA